MNNSCITIMYETKKCFCSASNTRIIYNNRIPTLNRML